jgi:hypothetical protein
MLGNKKGAVGSTISWVATTFIIVFLMIFLIVFTSLIYKTKGKGSFELETQTAAMGPGQINSFLNYLEINNSDGKTNLDKLKEEDFSFLYKDFYSSGEQTKKLLGADCVVFQVYVNGDLKTDSFYYTIATGGDLSTMIKAAKPIYILSEKGNMIDFRYYGGNCLK